MHLILSSTCIPNGFKRFSTRADLRLIDVDPKKFFRVLVGEFLGKVFWEITDQATIVVDEPNIIFALRVRPRIRPNHKFV